MVIYMVELNIITSPLRLQILLQSFFLCVSKRQKRAGIIVNVLISTQKPFFLVCYGVALHLHSRPFNPRAP